LFNGFDAHTIAHEFGHLLGFSDVNQGGAALTAGYLDGWEHSTDTNSVMYYGEDPKNPGPSYLDINEATALVNRYRQHH
jgi:isocitrate lyase